MDMYMQNQPKTLQWTDSGDGRYCYADGKNVSFSIKRPDQSDGAAVLTVRIPGRTPLRLTCSTTQAARDHATEYAV